MTSTALMGSNLHPEPNTRTFARIENERHTQAAGIAIDSEELCSSIIQSWLFHVEEYTEIVHREFECYTGCQSTGLLGWCKSGCLSGTGPSRASLPACAGISLHPVTLCLEPPPASCSIDVSKASGLRSAVNSQLVADRSKQNNHCDGGLMDCAVNYYKTVNVASESWHPYISRDDIEITPEITDIFSILEKGRSTLWRLGCHRGSP